MLISYPEVVGFRAKVVGTYADTTTRILPVTVETVSGEYFLFPNQPGGIGAMRYSGGYTSVGLEGCIKAATVGQYVINVDRGYAADLAGEAQPGTYEVPLEGSLLLSCTSASVGLEALLYLRAVAEASPASV